MLTQAALATTQQFQVNYSHNYLLGPRQTSDFDEQYYDKKIKQYCDKTTFFFFVV
jgi:hypothetical protein